MRPIRTLADSLGGRAQRSTGHAAIGQRFATTAEQCRTVLRALVEEFASHVASEGGAALDEGQVIARYTMKSERAVHAAMVGGPVEEKGKAGGGAGELDGDVELF